MEHQNLDICGTNNNDNVEDNTNNSNINNDQSGNEEKSEDDNDNDNENHDENNDENYGESPQVESSVELYKKFNFPKCIKMINHFFDPNTYNSDEYSKYSENGMTRFEDIVPAFCRLRFL